MKTLYFLLLFSSLQTQAARYIVETKNGFVPKSLIDNKSIKIEKLFSKDPSFFSRSFIVSGEVTLEQIKKHKGIVSVESTIEVSQLNLDPATTPSRLISDELYSYQWGLFNGGQVYYREKDDIHNLPLVGKSGMDIGWEKVFGNLPQEKVIVAVLDSGIDFNHPELKDKLWKNSNECGKDPKVDNDKNNLPGDCDGWDFTEAIDSDKAKLPQDFEGHGSHVAGIIAAAQNGYGIVGVNPNVQIMPIKVLRDIKTRSSVQSSESLSRGIVYATDMGASIINLSLGWPRSMEKKHLREAIQYALKQGVVLVAAAGNNNSSEPIYPCAYDGVICVAASTLDGSFAGFSNFGSHVDTIAPGEAILSLNPILYEPEFFSVPGFEIKSGTSQASPMVAGLISILRAQDNKITVEEILGRIYNSASVENDRKYILGGKATWDDLSRKLDVPVVRPVLKRVRQIVLVGTDKSSVLKIPFRNFGTVAENVEVRLESLSPSLEIIQADPVLLPLLKSSELKDIPFSVRVTDYKTESNVKIKMTVTVNGLVKTYLSEIPVIRDIRQDPSFKKISFAFVNNPLPLAKVEEGSIQPLISTIQSYGPSKVHEFFLKRTLENEKKIELTIFRKSHSRFEEIPKKIIIEKGIGLVNFIRVDLNLDGFDDYLVQTLTEVAEKKKMTFSFYNSNFEDLWPSFQNANVVLDTSVQSMNDLSFLKLNHSQLGHIMVPAFFTNGQIPQIDQPVSSWGKYDNNIETRFYILSPETSDQTLRIRSLTHNVWKDEVKKSLNSKWFETVVVEQLLPASAQDVATGTLRLFISIGELNKRKLYIARVNGNMIQLAEPLPQLVIQTDTVDSLFAISENGLEVIGDVYMNIYDRTRSKIITTKDQSQVGQYVYKHDITTDILSGHLVSFETNDSQFSVLQSREELIGISFKDGKTKISKRPKMRYSFLSQEVLSEMYKPVIFRRDGVSRPALYVDSTKITLNRINLFEEQDGRLVSSIQNSVGVPGTCSGLNPYYSKESQSHEFIFLCLDEASKSWVIRTLPME